MKRTKVIAMKMPFFYGHVRVGDQHTPGDFSKVATVAEKRASIFPPAEDQPLWGLASEPFDCRHVKH